MAVIIKEEMTVQDMTDREAIIVTADIIVLKIPTIANKAVIMTEGMTDQDSQDNMTEMAVKEVTTEKVDITVNKVVTTDPKSDITDLKEGIIVNRADITVNKAVTTDPKTDVRWADTSHKTNRQSNCW